MSPLERLLRRRLGHGAITVADYMALALGHERYGYYRKRDPLGTSGDFVTAPEVSQMFGELIGLWCAHVWGLIGAPRPIRLVELGPGRGSLMADALRAAHQVAPRFHAAIDLHLVETSTVLRARQREALGGVAATWHDDPAEVPDGPALVIANEFFDALPVHQLIRTAHGWRERLVGLDAQGMLAFEIGDAPTPLAVHLAPEVAIAPAGSTAELNLAAREMIAALAARLAEQGGAALLIDYGYAWPAAGDTLQAVRAHRPHAVLADPGEADLTAHVDFAALARAAERAGARTHGPVSQGIFLKRLGIEERCRSLCAQASADQRLLLETGVDRLIGDRRMGRLFQVLAVCEPRLEALPGFVS